MFIGPSLAQIYKKVNYFVGHSSASELKHRKTPHKDQ